jgi:hypothetical protein
MGDILKEAIADAKAVRETALQNAKMALEEAFTPQLKSMLSAKLKEDEDEFGDDEAEEGYHEGEHEGEEEVPAEEGTYEDEEFGGEDEFGEGEHGDEEPEVEEEGIIEIDGVKYAPVVAEEEDEEEFDEGEHEGGDDEEELDLESIIKELESELSEGDDDDEETVDESDSGYDRGESDPKNPAGSGHQTTESVEYEIDESIFTEDDDEDDDKEEVDEEVDETSGIGSGTGRGSTDKSSGIGTGGQEKATKLESIQSELKEYKEAVIFLKDKLHEVNILNAKLLFTNKLFKEYTLNNNQKLKVVETFDRTQSTREIKLVYSTLCEQFSDNGSIARKNSIKESASSTVGSTKPSKESRKVISEETQVANRFRKLAGLL